jgi:hypothetical protein
MKIFKTIYGFKIENIWNGDIKFCRLPEEKERYSILFLNYKIASLKIKSSHPLNYTLNIEYKSDMNIPETEIENLVFKALKQFKFLDIKLN